MSARLVLALVVSALTAAAQDIAVPTLVTEQMASFLGEYPPVTSAASTLRKRAASSPPTYPHNWRGGVVLRGYDVVAYHGLRNTDDGVRGTPALAHNITRGGYAYEFWFANAENLRLFRENEAKYMPMFGGFCTFGVATERPPQWPWTKGVMGPPAGPALAWAIHDGKLVLNINPQFRGLFNANPSSYLQQASERWIEYYGSLDDGPMNTRCYPSTWRACGKSDPPNGGESGPYGWAYLETRLGKEDGAPARSAFNTRFDMMIGGQGELAALKEDSASAYSSAVARAGGEDALAAARPSFVGGSGGATWSDGFLSLSG